MQQVKNAPISGTASEVGGVMSATILRKKQTESKMVISSVIFSPASGGRVNPSTVINEMRKLGIIRLKPENLNRIAAALGAFGYIVHIFTVV